MTFGRHTDQNGPGDGDRNPQFSSWQKVWNFLLNLQLYFSCLFVSKILDSYDNAAYYFNLRRHHWWPAELTEMCALEEHMLCVIYVRVCKQINLWTYMFDGILSIYVVFVLYEQSYLGEQNSSITNFAAQSLIFPYPKHTHTHTVLQEYS